MKDGKAAGKPRFEAFRAANAPLGLPEITAGAYLIRCMSDDGLGWCAVDGMGNKRPHPWAEIEAFARATGEVSEPWEMRILRGMSMAYLDGLDAGAALSSIAPTAEGDPDAAAAQKRALGAQIRAAIRGAGKR